MAVGRRPKDFRDRLLHAQKAVGRQPMVRMTLVGREYALAILESGRLRCLQHSTAKEYLSGGSRHGPAQGRPPELPHQVVRDLEGGIRIVRIDFGAGLVHPNDERGIALGDLVGDNPGYQFGGAALADDHQAAGR